MYMAAMSLKLHCNQPSNKQYMVIFECSEVLCTTKYVVIQLEADVGSQGF